MPEQKVSSQAKLEVPNAAPAAPRKAPRNTNNGTKQKRHKMHHIISRMHMQWTWFAKGSSCKKCATAVVCDSWHHSNFRQSRVVSSIKEHSTMAPFRRTYLLKRPLPTPHHLNAGTIVGTWIFHRHGDRAPNRYLGSAHHYDEECSHWFSRIPPSSARGGEGGGAFRELKKFYGVRVSETQNGGKFLDVGRAVS